MKVAKVPRLGTVFAQVSIFDILPGEMDVSPIEFVGSKLHFSC